MQNLNCKMNLRAPLVVILGATGSGKTKLSLDLAKKFGGEIIGADSMQVYKALDIITAKATSEERQIAPHHLIDILEPNEMFTVMEYRNKALPIINDLFSKNKLPIVVGGTNYYIESLLWKILVDEPGCQRKFEPGSNNEEGLQSNDLHKKLQELDPIMAQRIHPNNKRKILRSLEVLEQKGRKLSEILKEQQESIGGCSVGGGLRFHNSIILWLQCEKSILDERINKRVDTMVDEGLVQELRNFHESYNLSRLSSDTKPDYTKGIFQSIGFKEFHNYLFAEESLPQEEKNKLLQQGIEDLKMVTRRYARKQCKWITNRFLGRRDRDVPPVFGLSTEDVSKWDENVTNPAVEIIESYIYNKDCVYKRLPVVDIKSFPSSSDNTYNCDVCNRVFVGQFQWECHINSKKHKRVAYKKRKQVADSSSEDKTINEIEKSDKKIKVV